MTVYAYTDGSGAWPGYLATVKDDATADSIKAWFTDLEKTPAKKNFFIVDPGTIGAFKNGTIAGKYPDRYAGGTTAGASFGYLIVPEKHLVLISTSFAGMQDGVRLAGL
jgi:hypothetical protein